MVRVATGGAQVWTATPAVAGSIRRFADSSTLLELGDVGLDLAPQVDLDLGEKAPGKRFVELIGDGIGPPRMERFPGSPCGNKWRVENDRVTA